MNRTITRAMAVIVLVGVVLPNTLTAGHFTFLVSSSPPSHTHSAAADHDHSGHNQTPAPAAPDILSAEDAAGSALAGTTLWELFSDYTVMTPSNAIVPPAPPPRSL